MKLPKLNIFRNIDRLTTTVSYEVADSEMLTKNLLFDAFAQMNKRIGSYMARRYIEQNRDRLEQFVKHSTVRRHIERELRKLLNG